MGLNLSWLDEEKTILLQHGQGSISLEDYFEAINRIMAMIESVTHPVFIMAQLDRDLKPPPNPLRLMDATIRRILAQPNVQMMFVVEGNMFLTSLARIIMRYKRIHHRVAVVRTHAEALQRIQQEKEKHPQ